MSQNLLFHTGPLLEAACRNQANHAKAVSDIRLRLDDGEHSISYNTRHAQRIGGDRLTFDLSDGASYDSNRLSSFILSYTVNGKFGDTVIGINEDLILTYKDKRVTAVGILTIVLGVVLPVSLQEGAIGKRLDEILDWPTHPLLAPAKPLKVQSIHPDTPESSIITLSTPRWTEKNKNLRLPRNLKAPKDPA